MFYFRAFFCVCFTSYLCFLTQSSFSAGGIPLENNDLLTKKQKILIKNEYDIMDRQSRWQRTMENIVPVQNEPYDPEYIAILEDYDRRKESFALSHRDLQWHVVAKVMRNIDDVDERLALIESVRATPLWRQIKPTAAITTLDLSNWHRARDMFFSHLKKIKK